MNRKTKVLLCLLLPLSLIGINACAEASPPTDEPMPKGDSLVIPAQGFQASAVYSGYELVWEDQFEGNSLDTQSWAYQIGTGCPNLCGWGNAELQYYTDRPENLFLSQGYLVIEAQSQQIGDSDYSSARINTQGLRSFQFGRIDIRAAMPEGRGLWTALWLLNDAYEVNNPSLWWPKGGEIDIVETVGDRKREILGTAHFGEDVPSHQYLQGKYELAAHESFQDQFHVYSIRWQPDSIIWLVDNQPYHVIRKSQIGSVYPFNEGGFSLIMNLSVGGNLPGPPDSSTPFPARLIVDYVRYFKPE